LSELSRLTARPAGPLHRPRSRRLVDAGQLDQPVFGLEPVATTTVVTSKLIVAPGPTLVGRK
jgi:hypothetical protein